MLELPSDQKDAQPVLLIYGIHSSLERMYSTAQAVSSIGPVTVPDLPGFGGMMSLQQIGKRPSIDNLADYMADVIRQRYPKDEKFTLMGLSLGFVIAVRMLQRHPELVRQVSHIVSIVGFAKSDDFDVSPRRLTLMRRAFKVLAHKPTAYFVRHVILQKPFIAATYQMAARSHPKMKGYSWKERQDLINFEVVLWQTNEVRTYFAVLAEMLALDLTTIPLPLPVEHVAVGKDQYFNNDRVMQHLKKIFLRARVHHANLPNHVPTVVEDVEDARALFPDSLIAALREKS